MKEFTVYHDHDREKIPEPVLDYAKILNTPQTREIIARAAVQAIHLPPTSKLVVFGVSFAVGWVIGSIAIGAYELFNYLLGG
jgi:hypothetical protein